MKPDYNSILRAIVSDERKLFSERVKSLDHKILPGLGKLTWASQGVVDLFVRECRRHAGDINRVLFILFYFFFFSLFSYPLVRLLWISRRVVLRSPGIAKLSVKACLLKSKRSACTRVLNLRKNKGNIGSSCRRSLWMLTPRFRIL